MSEMVERVARALAALNFESPDEDFKAQFIESAWQIYVDDARTAIEAMREPTIEMIRTGRRDAQDLAEDGYDSFDPDLYRNMIDAALK